MRGGSTVPVALGGLAATAGFEAAGFGSAAAGLGSAAAGLAAAGVGFVAVVVAGRELAGASECSAASAAKPVAKAGLVPETQGLREAMGYARAGASRRRFYLCGCAFKFSYICAIVTTSF